MRKCPICGKSDIPDDIQFCPNPDCLWELVMWLGATEEDKERYRKQVEMTRRNYHAKQAIAIGAGVEAGAAGKNADAKGQIKEDNAGKQSEYSAETKVPKSISAPAAASPMSSPRAGDVWKEPVTGMEFVWVPGGCYQMGCGSWTSDCYDDEKPVHEVCLDGFWIGKYEVTQGQWKKIMRSNPSHSKSGDDFPVGEVSWYDAQTYIAKLSRQSGNQFALPTEAQWEYAARSGGKNEKYAGGSNVDSVAWHCGNSGGKSHRVGTKSPNRLGIYDMSGNVWEWCEDIFDKNAYSKHARNNPVRTSWGSARVYRGGSWSSNPRNVRTANRDMDSPNFRKYNLGFRLCLPDADRSLQPAQQEQDQQQPEIQKGIKSHQGLEDEKSRKAKEYHRKKQEFEEKRKWNNANKAFTRAIADKASQGPKQGTVRKEPVTGAGVEAIGKKADTQKQVKEDKSEKQNDYSTGTDLSRNCPIKVKKKSIKSFVTAGLGIASLSILSIIFYMTISSASSWHNTSGCPEPEIQQKRWAEIRDDTSPDAFKDYLQRCPEGVFAIDAQQKLENIYMSRERKRMLDRKFDIQIQKGLFYYEKKFEYNRAIKEFTRALDLKPDQASAYYYRGIVYYEKGDYDHAIEDFTEAIRLNPNYAQAYQKRGLAYNKKGQKIKAEKDLKKAIIEEK
jgi:formylglycine-generating enzyme required for sulfatase activity